MQLFPLAFTERSVGDLADEGVLYNPRLKRTYAVTDDVPIRTPDGSNGLRGSNGIELLTECERSRWSSVTLFLVFVRWKNSMRMMT